jgi:hypothetical protein
MKNTRQAYDGGRSSWNVEADKQSGQLVQTEIKAGEMSCNHKANRIVCRNFMQTGNLRQISGLKPPGYLTSHLGDLALPKRRSVALGSR